MAKSGTKESSDYTTGVGYEIKKYHYYRKHLFRILGDTQKALRDVTHLNLFPLESSIAEAVRMSRENVLRPPAIVVLGNARARLINFLLGEELLPPHSNSSSSNGWRWLRLQHGVKRHVRLSFGTDFEIIEPNLSANFNWDQITSQNLKRTDNLDLSTIIDIELCHPFLENGVQVLVPPDLGNLALNGKSSYTFTQESCLKNYETFFSKRGSFLKQVSPIVLYALDDIEYIENITDKSLKEHRPKNKLERSNSDNACSMFRKPNKNPNVERIGKGGSSKFYVDVDARRSCANEFCESNNLNESTRSDPDKSGNSLEYNLQNPAGLSEENLLDLRQIYDLHPNVQVLFILFSDVLKEEKDESYLLDHNENCSFMDESSPELLLLSKQKRYLRTLVQQLQLISNPLTKTSFTSHWLIVNDTEIKKQKSYKNLNKLVLDKDTTFRNKLNTDIVQHPVEFILSLKKFFKDSLKKYMLYDCNKLSEIHHALLQQFILSTFDMAREMQIIPRKIQYVAETEKHLYNTLNDTFTDGEKREELLQILQKVLHEMKNNIDNINFFSNDSPCNGSSECINMNRSTSIFYSEIRTGSVAFQDQIPCTYFENNSFNLSEATPEELNLIDQNIADNINLSEYCIVNVPQNELESAMSIEMDATEATNEILHSLQTDQSTTIGFDQTGSMSDNSVINFNRFHIDTPICNQSRSTQTSFKHVSLEVQRIVLGILSRNISIQLVKFVDCLRDSYFGTLQRCLESLEEGHRHRTASEAIRQILLVIRTVDLQQYASFSFLNAFVDQLKRFFQRLSLSTVGNKSCCAQSARWRRQIAIDTIDSLNPIKLTKLISSQLKDRIRQSHEQFQSALNSLSDHHAIRLQQTDDLKRTIRKYHAPRFARLCLESTSLVDLTIHGVPRLGKEIGRGQYGVVFSVKEAWGGFEPCAVKSVVPPDERHFNELAMEFFHTRNLPVHDRIVQLRGSVIDYSYESGSPAVYLISERLRWDLHCALLFSKMSFVQRMQIAVDIVEGIRYLHSQGLVHRDIKMKNVLLDEENRAKLTDLGFCIPEAMISGSVVGTPVHMAPELFSGIYDNSVDVYAFGILFWYICSGHVSLPSAFESFLNKEQLWIYVKKGLRPERLPEFSDTCWTLMKNCWSADSNERPPLGDVQPILEALRDNPQFNADL